MNIQLLHGHFNKQDAIDLLTKMVNIKIKFHEAKINSDSSEEDCKMRENRIKQLQKDHYEARKQIEESEGDINLESQIVINHEN